MVQNVPKRNAFVKLPFLVSTSFQIGQKLPQFFTDKLTSFNFKIVFTSPVKSLKLSRISYLRFYFQDLFLSISVATAILLIMVRTNAILKPKLVDI